MSNAAQSNTNPRGMRDARLRRVLIIAHSPAGESLPARLSQSGYEIRTTRAAEAGQAIKEFAPHVALVEADGEAGLELAARLRGESATAALPLVLLYERADPNLRAQAVRLGADDYFPVSTPPAEINARLDALFWRAEAGRRAATLAALERRAEIDDFMQLLEAVRADMDEGSAGALALVAAVQHHTPRKTDAAERTANETSAAPTAAPHETTAPAGATQAERHTLAAAYDFFQLNLRRVDTVAFYGPTLLLAYLPRKSANGARRDLARLSEEFRAAQSVGGTSFDIRLEIGVASFPADGTEIESLIDQAEAALVQTQAAPEPARTAGAREPQETSTARLPVVKEAERGGAQEEESEQEESGQEEEQVTPHAARVSDAPRRTAAAPAERSARPDFPPSRAVRESKQTDMETSMMPTGGANGAGQGQGTLAQAAADAAARERERRTRGHVMPRRLLLTISDPARMAQTNLLLRSAGYEVRAAFDGLQAINLLRIERPDLLVIEDALYGIDGLEALRRLHRQHHERLPLPVVLLLSNAEGRERVRAEARELGARGFVSVPYDPEELLTCVRTVGVTD